MEDTNSNEEKSAVENSKPGVHLENQEGVISLEDIDKFLEDNDPEFTKSLGEIVPEELESDADIEIMDLDDKSLEEEEESNTSKGVWLKKFPRLKAKLEIVGALLKSFPNRIRAQILKVRNEFIALLLSVWSFCRNDLPDRIRYIFSQFKIVAGYLQQKWKLFLKKSWREKVAYLAALVFLMGFVSLVFFNLGGRWLPSFSQDYIKDLSQVAHQIENYDPKDVVLLDDAFPQPHYTVLLNKIVLNLRRTSGHPNPMATFMFYVRVDSTETAIEIKDRQVELLDYVQRALEEMSYEEVNGPGGRLSIKAKTRAEINRVLNQGRVLDVLIEMMITKP